MGQLAIIKNDPWLEPYAAAIEGRHQDAINKEKEQKCIIKYKVEN